MKAFAFRRGLPRAKVLWATWLMLSFSYFAIGWYPIRFGSLRALVFAVVVFWCVLSLALLWPHKVLRLCGVGLAGLAALFLLAPGRAVDAPRLRESYVRSLINYEGTTYVWGGENARGIDCSGLVRRGLIDANWKTGLATFNPAPVRRAVAMWWFDCSAKALKESYRGWTKTISTTPSLNALDYETLQPGDIAVTSNGVHTLAYIGDATWIEADPKAWKTIRVRVPSETGWFRMPVHLLRWRQLES